MGVPDKFVISFGVFEFHTPDEKLYKYGSQVKLDPLAAKLLGLLISAPDRLVPYDEIYSRLWGATSVDHGQGTRRCLSQIRSALGDNSEAPIYIQTERGKGCRFIAPTRSSKAEAPPLDEDRLASNRPTREERPERSDDPVLIDPPVDPLIYLEETRPWLRRTAWATIGILVLCVSVLIVFVVIAFSPTPKLATAGLGRLLVRATSQGRKPILTQLAHQPNILALSPDGRQLFIASNESESLSFMDTTDGSLRTIPLPTRPRSMVVSSKGSLYIGSDSDGITIVEDVRGRLRTRSVPTGGRVWDLAITPDGETLFLALGYSGLKRFLTRTDTLDTVSNQACPVGVAVDGQGKYLYVSYQCSGPGGGRPGHDSTEVFDIERTRSLGFVKGPPLVGGHPVITPGGKMVMIDSRDACSEKGYDYEGCPAVPSRAYSLLRAIDREFLKKAVPYPRDNAPTVFLDDARLLLTGGSISVLHTGKDRILEDWRTGPTQDAVFDSTRGRLYVEQHDEKTILTLQAESPECSWSSAGLVLNYPFDGVTNDSVGLTTFQAKGRIHFSPGRVGQALSLDGNGFLSERWTAGFGLLAQDSTLALYLSPSDQNEIVILDWESADGSAGVRLLESKDNHFVFQSWPGGDTLTSTTSAAPGTWYHLAVTKRDRLSLYVNGAMEAAGKMPSRSDTDGPLVVGADQSGRRTFHGSVDELAFYNRALTADEIRAMYQLREVGPCKL